MPSLLIHRAFLTSLLGTALAACSTAQQDNHAAASAGTAQAAQAPQAGAPAGAPHAWFAARAGDPAVHGLPGGPQDAPVFLRVPVAPRQAWVQQQSAPRLRGPMLRSPGNDGPRLGVTVAETPDGLQVNGIDEGSLAQSAGVRAQDVVLRIGDVHVHDVGDIQRALRAFKPGDKVKVGVIRAGEGIVELEGTLPEPKAPPAPPQLPAADGFKGGFLGVQMARAEDGAATAGPGVLVASVVPDSAAWFAGLQDGDRLLALDGKPLASGEDLVGAVSGKEPGSLVELRYSRDGAEHTVQVRLGHRQQPDLPGGLRMFGGDPGQGMPGMPGMPAMPGMQLRFGDPDWTAIFPGQDGDSLPFLQDPHHFFGGTFKDGSVLDLGPGSQQVRIEIENGKGTMTVTRDGETSTYTLDADGRWVTQDGQAAPDGTSEDTQDAPRVRNG